MKTRIVLAPNTLSPEETQLAEEFHHQQGYKSLWYQTEGQAPQTTVLPDIDSCIYYIEDHNVCLYNSVFFFDSETNYYQFVHYFWGHKHHNTQFPHIILLSDTQHPTISNTIPPRSFSKNLISPLYILNTLVLPHELLFLEATCFVLNAPQLSPAQIQQLQTEAQQKAYTFLAQPSDLLHTLPDINPTAFDLSWEAIWTSYIAAPLPHECTLVYITDGLLPLQLHTLSTNVQALATHLQRIPKFRKRIFRSYGLSPQEEETVKNILSDPEKLEALFKLLPLSEKEQNKLLKGPDYPPVSPISFPSKTELILESYQITITLTKREMLVYRAFYENRIRMRNQEKDLQKLSELMSDLQSTVLRTRTNDPLRNPIENIQQLKNFEQVLSRIRRSFKRELHGTAIHYTIEKHRNQYYIASRKLH